MMGKSNNITKKEKKAKGELACLKKEAENDPRAWSSHGCLGAFVMEIMTARLLMKAGTP